jgi:hypothetical protein
MKFKVLTLADITKTGARRGEESIAWQQQQNYNTFIGTLGLRVNPTVTTDPKSSNVSVGNLGFGKKYKGKQRMWEFSFETEYEGGLTIEMLEQDFDLIPIIKNLEETIDIDPSTFRTKDEELKNIIFMYVDND